MQENIKSVRSDDFGIVLKTKWGSNLPASFPEVDSTGSTDLNKDHMELKFFPRILSEENHE